MLEGLVLGIVQGITEWLPVSSQGMVTATGSLLFDLELDEAIAFALWLHLGTAVAAAVAFRRDLWVVAKEAISDPAHPSPLLRFLVIATVVSAAVGLPIVLALDELSAVFGAGAMLLVGTLMLVTGAMLRAQPLSGTRDRTGLSAIDAVLTGVAQGLAALPGLSRSGLTVATLLGRRVDRAEALALSFLIGIPAGLGAALFAGLRSDLVSTANGLLSAAVAFVLGLATLQALMAVARKVNFGLFVILAGLAVIGGGIWQIVV